jgi:hypothetical protein
MRSRRYNFVVLFYIHFFDSENLFSASIFVYLDCNDNASVSLVSQKYHNVAVIILPLAVWLHIRKKETEHHGLK